MKKNVGYGIYVFLTILTISYYLVIRFDFASAIDLRLGFILNFVSIAIFIKLIKKYQLKTFDLLSNKVAYLIMIGVILFLMIALYFNVENLSYWTTLAVLVYMCVTHSLRKSKKMTIKKLIALQMILLFIPFLYLMLLEPITIEQAKLNLEEIEMEEIVFKGVSVSDGDIIGVYLFNVEKNGESFSYQIGISTKEIIQK